MTEENFEGAEDYGGGEEESYYDEGAYEGGEDMGVGGAAGGDESKGRLTHFHFSERLVSVAPLAEGVAGVPFRNSRARSATRPTLFSAAFLPISQLAYRRVRAMPFSVFLSYYPRGAALHG